ncbi:Protein kinase domain,Protein kinase-like domain,Serine/threonine-protein kinase, active [Cinara cedri]|uniref:cAMP-dependent protein kinase n=1 Tax=Cinara cedri TaxID=506608 RepID=A0A5E4NSE4_9HEMI|nr:Protein kinase domain,Protein kinase-like domain,Serine/threonine-protein kinase, active [Cinara cedri]
MTTDIDPDNMAVDYDCTKQNISNIKEYLDCSKIKFEYRLTNDKMQLSTFDDFVLLKTIGLGAFGRVFLVHHKSDNKTFLAMKVIKKEEVLRRNYLQHVLNEKRFLTAIQHPFIVHMEYYAHDICNLYFVMPFAVGGDMFGLIRENGMLNEYSAKFYSGQLVLALEYLHLMNIVYRDLKPENVLIDANGYILLTDLGLSKRIAKRTTTLCGTPQYLAPEIISVKAYGKPVDWWALGIVIFEMVAGAMPFNANTDKKLYVQILSGSYKMSTNFTPDLADLIRNLLQVDLTKRFGNLQNGIDDIKQHRWFKQIEWIMLLNKQIEPPFVPNYTSASDTSNFESYVDEDVAVVCEDIDQTYFENF